MRGFFVSVIIVEENFAISFTIACCTGHTSIFALLIFVAIGANHLVPVDPVHLPINHDYVYSTAEQ